MRKGKQVLWQAGLAAICLMLLFSLFPAGLVFADVGSPPPVLRFEQISLREGLSQSSVYAILQDHYGFLWFGTEGGLNKYDGYQFTIYKHDPDDPSTLANNIISALYEDRLGILWVGTGEGLDRFNRESGTFAHYKKNPQDPDALSGTLVWALLEDSDGALWVGTNDGGLNRFERDTNSFTHFRHDPADPNSIGGDSVKALYEDEQGMLWVGTDAGLERFDRENGTFTHFPRPAADQGNPNSSLVLTIYEDSQGRLWAGTNGEGLGKFDRSTLTWTDYTNDPNNPDSLSSDVVWAVLEDLKGRLWIGSDGGGLDLLDPQQDHFHHYRHDPSKLDSLSRDSVRALFEDRSGVFWVGTYGGGLSKSTYNINKFALYRQEPGLADSLSDNYIWSIGADSSGALWLGTFQGGLNRLDINSGSVTVYRHDPKDPASLSSDDVRAVLVDGQGTVWAGTGAQGLNRLDPQSGTFVQYHHDPNDPNSLISDQIRVLFEDRSGNLWVGTYANGLDRFDRQSGVFTHYRSDATDPHSLISDRVRCLYQDRKGYLWIGTSGGISRLEPEANEFTRYSSDAQNPNSLSNPTVFSFYEDADEILWIATFGGGLNRFDPTSQTFTHYTETDGLPHNQVYNILADASGNLWLSTNNGISRFNPKTRSFRNYGIEDGLQNIEFNLGSAYQSKDGQMFFGGIDGLNAFYPEQVHDSDFSAPVVITAFQKFNQTVLSDLSPDQTIQLSHNDNFFSFEFAALDFTAPEKNQYAYMLEGFDKDWIEAGTRRYASYTNLGGGNYTFRVKGTNSDGVWNEVGISIPITITPPFWQTWWFTLLAVLALTGGTTGIYAVRARSFRLQKEKLESQVAQRTAEIEQRRRVAESLRDILTVLNSNRPLDEILALIADQTIRLLACDGIAIYRLRPEEGVLTIQTARGLGPDYVTGLAVPLGRGVTGIAAQNRQPVTVNDSHGSWLDQTPAEVAPDQRRLLESIRKRYRAILSAPLIVQRELYGALTLYYYSPREISQEEVDLAVTVAEQAALALETARLRDQAGELAASAERSRLARELHDAVTQTLFASNLVAEALPIIWERNPKEGQQRLKELGQLNRGALAEMRSLLLELRPAALLEAELADLFRYLTDAFTGRTHVPVSLQVDTDGRANKNLPAEVKVGLYRIAQEALNNIAKHARASQVAMEVNCQVGQIQIRIQDNGQGFDTRNVQAGHFGLGIMKERAASIGAVMEVNSEIGKGTEVYLSWASGDGEPGSDGLVTSRKQ
jgi:ligand-binding sensor domain-containing protein/signal transduction histidine kinase